MFVCVYIYWCIYRFRELLYCLTRETQGRTKWFCAWHTPRRTVRVSLQCFTCLRELRSKSGQGQGYSSVGWASCSACCWCRFSSPVQQGIFWPHSQRWVQTVLRCSYSRCVQWHYICSHVKLPKQWQLFQLSLFGSMKMQHALAQPLRVEHGCRSNRGEVVGGWKWSCWTSLSPPKTHVLSP